MTAARKQVTRPCDRCATVREVRSVRSPLNLCRDCVDVLTPTERASWRRNRTELRVVASLTRDQLSLFAA